MNDEQKAKVAWLRRAFYAEKKVKALEMKLERDRSLAERISRNYSGISTAVSGNSTEDALIRLADTEQQTKEQLDRLENIRKEISLAIAEIDGDDLQAVLMWHYLNYCTFDQTAEKMHYHRATVCKKHKIALDKLAIESDYQM